MTNPPTAAPGVAVEAIELLKALCVDSMYPKLAPVLAILQAERLTPSVEAVEAEVSKGASAWDCVPPEELIAAVVKLSIPRTALLAGAAGGEPVSWVNRLGRMKWDYERGEMCADDSGPFVCYSDVADAASAHPPVPVRVPQEVTDAEVHAARQVLGYKAGQVRKMLENFAAGRIVTSTLPASIREFIDEVADDTSFEKEIRDWAKRLRDQFAATPPSAAPAERRWTEYTPAGHAISVGGGGALDSIQAGEVQADAAREERLAQLTIEREAAQSGLDAAMKAFQSYAAIKGVPRRSVSMASMIPGQWEKKLKAIDAEIAAIASHRAGVSGGA